MVGDENKNKNKKDKLNLIRLKLARHVIETFSLSNDTQIRNRTAARYMANDIWNLIDTCVESRLTTDCSAVFLSKNLNSSFNDSTSQAVNISEKSQTMIKVK